MLRPFRLTLAAGLILCAVFLLRYSVDREFINLTPTPGASYIVPLKADVSYELQLVARQGPITRLGFFLKPLQENLPDGTVTIEVYQHEQLLSRQSVTTPFIDAQGFTQLRLTPPLAIIPDEPVRVRLTVTNALKERIGLLQRQSDETFTSSDAVFSIDGVAQGNPIAHQAYFAYRPALALHSSGLLLLVAVALLLPSSFKKYTPLAYAMAIGLVALLPMLGMQTWSGVLLATVTLSWWGMFRLLRQQGAGVIPAGIGAHAASLTTYFVFHILAGQFLVGQYSLALLALLPLIFSYSKKPLVYLLSGAVIILAIIPQLHDGVWAVASLRDIWLDPNQTVEALKIVGSELRWWHFGSYVGVVGAVLASLGALTRGKRHWHALALLALSLLLVQVVGPRFLPTSSFFVTWAYLIIIPTYTVAYFIGLGADSLQRYLGSSRLTKALLGGIGLVALLDSLYVFSTAMESFYL